MLFDKNNLCNLTVFWARKLTINLSKLKCFMMVILLLVIQYRFFSISCRFLNYINQLTVIICYQSVSILSFIDWSSLDIAKHVRNNTFHEHYGFSMEKNISKRVFSGSLKFLLKLMSTSSKYLIREFWDKYVIIIIDDFLVLPARSCWYVMTLGWLIEARFFFLSLLKSNLQNGYTVCWWLL